ncbi:helix-turn-helix transcriptional regulator [Crassaminicella profunda]|uniref:helix-turn-helix transcriptional regulator n=1 Tax=Crassaminicella profunda TaxID=1286698 RepID=UPI001CA78442|nr:LuxR family transcriptional regulator [Crassaminicella profunda]QZY54923.1 LuxR C-terminal-related transcriptional regulator [Crassaminicella profunda]
MNHIDTVIGREELKNQINQLYKNINKNVLLVKGSSGIGKTFAIRNILKTYPNVKVITCKQNHQYIMEFTLIKNLIDKIMEQILVLPTKKFNPLIYQIKNTLHTELEYIAYFADTVSKIFKDTKIKQIKDYTRQKYKIRKAVNNFVKLIVNTLGNICIHLDDIQWADENSLDMIKALIKDKSINATFILSYRDEFTQLSKEEKSYGVVELCPLKETEVKKIITERTSKDIIHSDYLARYIYSITLGNPFYITKVIDEFRSKQIIEHSHDDRYIVHIDKLTKSNISENVNEVMLSRVLELNNNEKLFLEYLSCFGGDISRRYFEKIFSQKSDTIIKSLIEKSFIFITDERYSFTHDIIFEYIYKNIDSKQREHIYYAIAKDLTEFYKTDKNLWSLLVTAIMNSRNIKWSKKRTKEWFYILSEACQHNVNYKKIREILITCKEIMDKNTNLHNNEILFKLAKCHYLLGDLESAKSIYDQMKERSSDKNHLLKIEDEQMNMFAYTGNHKEAMNTGIKMLEILGFEYNINNKEALIASFNDFNTLDNLDTWVCKDEAENVIDEQYILYRMIPSTKILCQSHFQYSLLLISNLALKKTKSKYKLFALTSCSFIMFNLLHNYKMGKQLSDIVMNNIDFNSEEEFVQETIAFYLTFVHHWSNDIYQTIQLLEKNNLTCLEKGIITHFEYSLASLMFAYCITGKNVSEASLAIRQRIEMLDITSVEGTHFINTYVNSIFDNYAKELKIKKAITLSSEQIKIEAMVGIWFSILASYINNHIEKVYRAIKLLQNHFVEVKGHIAYIQMIFITTLIMLEYHKNLDKGQQAIDKAIIDENRIFLENTISHYEKNHLARYYFVKGMYEKVFGDKELSIGYINKGISIAKKKSNHLLLVIGNRLAEICNSIPELKSFYSSEGTKALQKYISNDDENEKFQNSEAEENTSGYLILQAMQNMDENEAFKYFLNSIVESSLCNYACVLLNENNTYKLAYEKKENMPAIHYFPYRAIKDNSSIDKELLIMSKRLSDTIIKNKNSDKEKLIIILPIQVFGIEIGIFYIEAISHNKDKIIDLIHLVLPYLIYKLDGISNLNTDKNSDNYNNVLTPREIEILKHLSKGDSNQKISEIEFISVGTVKSHLNSIYTKLGVNNRRKAIIMAKDQHII